MSGQVDVDLYLRKLAAGEPHGHAVVAHRVWSVARRVEAQAERGPSLQPGLHEDVGESLGLAGVRTRGSLSYARAPREAPP